MKKTTTDSEMIESMAKWFTTRESLLTTIFALAILIVTLCIIYRPRQDPLSVRLLGTLVLRYDLEVDQFHNEDRAIKILEAWQKAE